MTSNSERSQTKYMWIERNGGPDPIEPRFRKFLEKCLFGRSLDLDGDKETRPDYACLGGSLIIEIKRFIGDPNKRLSNAVAAAAERDTWPKFLGEWPLESVLKNLPAAEAEALRKRVFDRLGRAIVTHMEKANSQLNAYCHVRSDVHLRLLVLINEDFEAYDPTSVTSIVSREYQKMRHDGSMRYADIDAVVFLTERHATLLNGSITFPVVAIESPWIEGRRTAVGLMNRLIQRWGRWSHELYIDAAPVEMSDFVAIDESPDMMRRQDLWVRDYKRKPYMRSWSDEDVIGFWDTNTVFGMLSFLKTSPVKIPKEQITMMMEDMAHILQEFAFRGITMDRLRPTKERNETAIGKLPYDSKVKDWLREKL